MKKYIIVFLAVIFMLAGGCFKKKTATPDLEAKNDIITELIKEDILGSTNSNTNDVTQNAGLMETISNTNRQNASVSVPVIPPVTSSEVRTTAESARINDRAVEAPAVKTVRKTSTVKTSTTVAHQGSYIKIGNDSIGQSTSPRKPIKLTLAVFNGKASRYADFKIYAVPVGAALSTSSYYLVSSVRNVEVINGQAQLTKYWNGKNINGDFLPQGKYKFYLSYILKAADKSVVKKDGRYWGGENYYLRLY